MKINIGLTDQHRKKVCVHLNKLLSDEYTLYTTTLNYHWNVIDPYFGAMHAFFKDQYEKLFDITDDIAERVRTLDELAFGAMQDFLEHAHVKERPTKKLTTKQMLKNLLEDHEAIIRHMRQDIEIFSKELGDEGTANFMTEIMEKHEKIAWMIRSCLGKAK